MVAVRDSELNIFRGNGVSLEGGQTQNVQYSQSPSLPRETKFIGFENNSGINSALFTDITPNGSIMAIDNVLFTPGCDAIVSTDQSYMIDHLTLGNYFSFDAWWEMGQEPDGKNFDLLFFRQGEWKFFGWDINTGGSLTEWESLSFWVPSWSLCKHHGSRSRPPGM